MASVPIMKEHGPATFVLGFIFGTWEFICLEIKYVTVPIFDVLVLPRGDDQICMLIG